MKKRFGCILAVVWLGLLWAWPVEAGMSPVRLQVTKLDTKGSRTIQKNSSGTQRMERNDIGTYFEIDVTNLSTSPLNNVLIKWTVLYNPHGCGNPQHDQIAEGNHACNIMMGQKYHHVTTPVFVTTTTVRTPSGSHGGFGGRVHGYLVEVCTGNRVLAEDGSEIKIRQLIEDLKKTREKAPAPKGRVSN